LFEFLMTAAVVSVRVSVNAGLVTAGTAEPITSSLAGGAADDFCQRQFFATEAAFRSVLGLFNLLSQ
jgi:hypothetical protein